MNTPTPIHQARPERREDQAIRDLRGVTSLGAVERIVRTDATLQCHLYFEFVGRDPEHRLCIQFSRGGTWQVLDARLETTKMIRRWLEERTKPEVEEAQGLSNGLPTNAQRIDNESPTLLRSHKWVGRQQGGNPAEAGSYEWVRYCDVCGMEDTCEDEPLPPCPGNKPDGAAPAVSCLQTPVFLKQRIRQLNGIEYLGSVSRVLPGPGIYAGNSYGLDKRGAVVWRDRAQFVWRVMDGRQSTTRLLKRWLAGEPVELA